MKIKWSRSWNGSKQPRKQRKYAFNAPLHRKHKMMSVHLEASLRKKIGRRSLPIRKGDEVKIVRGKKKGLKGKISRVDIGKGVVFVENQIKESVRGNKIPIPFQPSNLLLVSAVMDDKCRNKRGKKKEKKDESPKKTSSPKKLEHPKKKE